MLLLKTVIECCCLQDFATYEAYKKVHGVDLPLRDIEECVLYRAVTPLVSYS